MKYKQHHDLGISFAEYGALLGTRAMLANKLLVEPGKGGDDCDIHKVHRFNMAVPARQFGCGSVSCIGGTMALIMGMSAYDASRYVELHDGTNEREPTVWTELFYPGMNRPHKTSAGYYDYSKITAEQAVAAIDAFLCGKTRIWPVKVLKAITTNEG